MTDTRWALLSSSEDGNPLRFLTEAELASLLADPSAWGVAEFINAHDMGELDRDPNYWPDKVGVLLRVEVIVPERARGYSLPAANPIAVSRLTRAGDGAPLHLGKVIG
jgi:hypothetical protein